MFSFLMNLFLCNLPIGFVFSEIMFVLICVESVEAEKLLFEKKENKE